MPNLIINDLTRLFLFDVCRHQFNQMAANADQYANELRTTKGEISGLTRTINHLRNEIEIAQVQVSQRLTTCPMFLK